MKQRAITLLANLADPAKQVTLENLLRRRGDEVQPGPASVAGGFGAIQQLHFLSMFVIGPHGDKPAQLGLEAHFDGGKREFVLGLVEKERGFLDQAFSFCSDYPGRTATKEQVADYLAAAEICCELSYVGSPGRGAEQIEEERQFAARVEQCVDRLGRPDCRRFDYVMRIWRALAPADRELVRNTPPAPYLVRHRLLEHPYKYAYELVLGLLKLPAVLCFALVAARLLDIPVPDSLTAPESVIAGTLCWAKWLLLFAGAVIVLLLLQFWHEFPKELTAATRRYVAGVKLSELFVTALRALPDFAVLLGVIALLYWQGDLIAYVFICSLLWALGIAGIAAAIVLAVLIWIGFAELTDSVCELKWDAAKAGRIGEREERGVHNHFVSVTDIRPGPIRWFALWVWLQTVNIAALVLYNPRGLFSTQSIHFARWAILPGRRQLLFLTNYGGSFGGYLGIFATLGAPGVSGIWGNTELFPRTFLLFGGGGARDEQRFKCRARDSQFESLLWYRRYADLTMSAIARNAAIREDLKRFSECCVPGAARMSEADLDTFLRRLSVRCP